MQIDHKRAWTMALSILVGGTMLFTALGAIAWTTSGPMAGSAATHISNEAGDGARPAATCGQVPVPLGSAGSYGVLASSTVTSTGATAVTGNLGLSPGTSVTGFPPGTLTGIQNVTTPGAAGAEANLTIAYNNATARSNCAVTVAGNIGGQTLTPGLYKSTSTLAISSGDLTLSGGGNPNGVFVFQVASSLTTTAGRKVILSEGAQADNVFWVIGSSATLGTTSVMMGTVVARDSISMLTGSDLTGRALVLTGEVSLSDTTIVVPVSTSASTYSVTFTETGLPSGTSWSVTSGGDLTSSIGSTNVFADVNGTYAYAISVVGFVATPSSGNVTVNGASSNRAIAFTAAASGGSFDITFTETGLAPGTVWSVTLNQAVTSSVVATVEFASVAGGMYAFSVGVVSNYTASPITGSVTVNGVPATQTIVFTPASGTGPVGNTTGGGGSSSSGIPSWGWVVIGVAAIGAVGAGTGFALKGRGKRAP